MSRHVVPRDPFARLYLIFACLFALIGLWPLAMQAWGDAITPCGLAFLFAVASWCISRGEPRRADAQAKEPGR